MAAFHIMTVLSSDADAIMALSGEEITEEIDPSWLLSVCRYCLVATSQSLIVLSLEADATVVPLERRSSVGNDITALSNFWTS